MNSSISHKWTDRGQEAREGIKCRGVVSRPLRYTHLLRLLLLFCANETTVIFYTFQNLLLLSILCNVMLRFGPVFPSPHVEVQLWVKHSFPRVGSKYTRTHTPYPVQCLEFTCVSLCTCCNKGVHEGALERWARTAPSQKNSYSSLI